MYSFLTETYVLLHNFGTYVNGDCNVAVRQTTLHVLINYYYLNILVNLAIILMLY